MILYKSRTYKLEISVISRTGNFVSGLTVPYYVYDSSDNSLVASGNMVGVGISGIYQADIQFDTVGQYRAEYHTPVPYENGIDNIFVIEESNEILNRILGLCQENYRIFNPVYDKSRNMTSAIIKTYPSATDVDNDTNEIAEYHISATYSKTNHLMIGYKVVKI